MSHQLMIPPLQKAIEHHKAKRFSEAEAIYRQLLTEYPNYTDVLVNYAMLAADIGRLDVAEDLLRRATGIDPHSGFIVMRFGDILLARGKHKEAVAAFERSAYLQPGSAAPLCALARALPIQQAMPILQRAVAAEPTYQPAHRLLASVLLEMNQLKAAADEAERATMMNVKDAEAWNIFGTAMARLQQPRSITAFRKAIEADPNFAPAYQNLALALANTSELDDAEKSIQKAISLVPDNALVYSTLAIIKQRQGLMEEAIDAARKSVQYPPDSATFHSNLLLFLNYSSKLSPEEIASEHRKFGERFARFPIAPHSNSRDADRKLRIGFVSADFRSQSVAYFFEPLLANFDRSQFEFFCYYNYPQSDDITARFKKLATQWRDVVSISDEQLAQQIRNDAIDILVDLSGHTAENRLITFARKPAPIQITWLGYPNTLGLPTVDYRMTDAIADPPGKTEQLHTEKLLRLQSTWCYQPPLNCPAVEPRNPHEPIIFGAFNILSKFSAECLELWARVLGQIPNSKLLIKSKGLGVPSTRERITRIFESHNIGQDRLELRGPEPFFLLHLKAHKNLDVMLDPFPYNGTTTTCEAMYMGVPVITLAGKAHVSRVGASLLTSVGLPDLIAQSPDEFIEIAKRLAKDRERLAKLRGNLREQMKSSRLMNATGFAEDFQKTLRDVWRSYTAG